MQSQTLWQLLLSNRDAIKKTADEKWWIVCIIKQAILFLVYLLVYIDRNYIGMNLPMLSFMFCHIEQYSHHFGLLEKRSKWKQYHYWYGIKLIVSYTTEWIVNIPFSSIQNVVGRKIMKWWTLFRNIYKIRSSHTIRYFFYDSKDSV
jgi:hypothetical protein